MGSFIGKLYQRFVWNEGDLTFAQRSHAVIHLSERQAVKVNEVARDVQRCELTCALFKHVRAASIAFDNQTAVRRARALRDDFLIALKRVNSEWKLIDELPFIVTNDVAKL